jgi:predicted nucleic acid-binding protein
LIVVDASALVKVLTPARPDHVLDRRLQEADSLHAPHLVDVEVANGLRRAAATGSVSTDRAQDALLDLDTMPITRYPHGALLPRAWELRDNLTAYDAMYVALAEVLEAPLVTCDARLARTPGIQAAVELFEP